MHLLEHETQMPGTPHAYEITWEPCTCDHLGDHVRPPGSAAAAWELEEFLMPEDLMAVVA